MTTYNLVNSVKGGCGKTTFSIWMAYYLNTLSEEDYQKAKEQLALAEMYVMGSMHTEAVDEVREKMLEMTKKISRCEKEINTAVLIDMDLLGTSMLAIFNGNHDACKTAVTNEIFQGVKDSRKEFIEKIKLKNGKYINVIFSSMNHLERDKFKAGRYAGYSPVVKHSMFRSGLRELLKCNKRIDGKKVKHFILDMPPNSDGFSDAAMECIFNKKYSVADNDDRKNLFIMIGSDWGQTIATIAELETLLKRSDDMMPDRIFLVINHNLRGNFGEECYQIRKDKIEEALKGMNLAEKERERFFFLKMYNNEKYTELGIGMGSGGIGLRNADSGVIGDAFPKAVITAAAQYGKEFEDILNDDNGKRKLRKLILGEDDEKNG